MVEYGRHGERRTYSASKWFVGSSSRSKSGLCRRSLHKAAGQEENHDLAAVYFDENRSVLETL